jgi:hypothetical protein
VPTEANLHPGYRSFSALEAACRDFCGEVNERPHRVTRRPPAQMLAAERAHLHVVPEQPHTIAFGQTRMVSRESTISLGGVIYSVPHELIGSEVWVRVAGEELVVVAADGSQGAREVARHALSTPGSPRICDEHYPPRPEGALRRTPRAQSAAEAAFLAIGPGAERWLVKAAAAGTGRIATKMAEAVVLGALVGNERVEAALARAAEAERFGEGDLRAILDHRAGSDESARRADERHTLQAGTGAWARVGR